METGRRDTGSLCKPLRSSKQPHWHVNPEGRKHAALAVPLITGQVFLASREGQLLADTVADGVVFDANALEGGHGFSISINLNAASEMASSGSANLGPAPCGSTGLPTFQPSLPGQLERIN